MKDSLAIGLIIIFLVQALGGISSSMTHKNATTTIIPSGANIQDIHLQPRADYKVYERLDMNDGSYVNVEGMANGTVAIIMNEVENPSRFTVGFMDIFFNITMEGQGTLTWLNITIQYQFIPKGYDESTIALFYFYQPDGPWLKCMYTGVFPSSNQVWANFFWENVSIPYIFAPRAQATTTSPSGRLKGWVMDVNNRSIPNSQVELYKSAVRINITNTDKNGFFLFDNIETGTYEIRITCIGYEFYPCQEITVVAGEDNELGIVLSKKTTMEEKEEESQSYGLYIMFIIVFAVILAIVVFILLQRQSRKKREQEVGVVDVEEEKRYTKPPDLKIAMEKTLDKETRKKRKLSEEELLKVRGRIELLKKRCLDIQGELNESPELEKQRALKWQLDEIQRLIRGLQRYLPDKVEQEEKERLLTMEEGFRGLEEILVPSPGTSIAGRDLPEVRPIGTDAYALLKEFEVREKQRTKRNEVKIKPKIISVEELELVV